MTERCVVKYSFISTSQGGRLSVFQAFIESLQRAEISDKDYEVVFVDQTLGEYDEFINTCDSNINVIKSNRIPLSTARNLALSKSIGEFVFFSDDDADYSQFDFNEFDNISRKSDIVSCRLLIAPDGKRSYGGRNFPSFSKYLSVREVFSCCLSLTIIMRKSVLTELGGFDENYGAGAKYSGSEETDLILRAYCIGLKVDYSPRLIVMHPDEYLDVSYQEQCEKFQRYALAYARVCRKYSQRLNYIPLLVLLKNIFTTLVAILVKGQKQFYFKRLSGFFAGFFSR
ncbi:glycosyltransferase family 2 protein [Vibrio coralliilyticus]|uniref:glycosyltransferase family 2 protein n=1 Tax=Vibrio coralliilyticus TaxID=190893 RepID=UPI002FD6FE85